MPKLFLRLFRYCKTRYFNFILLNTSFIFSKRINWLRYPACQQKTFLTGLGKVYLGKYCSFGYKLGGGGKEAQLKFNPDTKTLLSRLVIM